MAPRKKSSLSVDALQSAAVAAREGGQAGGGGGPKSPAGRRKRGGEGVAEDGGLTEEDLSAPITIGLCETPTIMLLEIRGSAVATDLRDFGRFAVISAVPVVDIFESLWLSHVVLLFCSPETQQQDCRETQDDHSTTALSAQRT